MAAAAVSSDSSPRIYTQSQGQTITSTTVTLHPVQFSSPMESSLTLHLAQLLSS